MFNTYIHTYIYISFESQRFRYSNVGVEFVPLPIEKLQFARIAAWFVGHRCRYPRTLGYRCGFRDGKFFRIEGEWRALLTPPPPPRRDPKIAGRMIPETASSLKVLFGTTGTWVRTVVERRPTNTSAGHLRCKNLFLESFLILGPIPPIWVTLTGNLEDNATAFFLSLSLSLSLSLFLSLFLEN